MGDPLEDWRTAELSAALLPAEGEDRDCHGRTAAERSHVGAQVAGGDVEHTVLDATAVRSAQVGAYHDRA